MTDRPLIALTTWRRDLPTYLGERTDLFSVGTEYVRFFSAHGLSVILVPECTGESIPPSTWYLGGSVVA